MKCDGANYSVVFGYYRIDSSFSFDRNYVEFEYKDLSSIFLMEKHWQVAKIRTESCRLPFSCRYRLLI